MKMKLNLKERIALGSILPEKGNYAEMIIINSISEKARLTVDDIERFEFTQHENGSMSWNQDGNIEVEIEFQNSEIDMIKKAADVVDSEGNVSQFSFSLFRKINELEN